MELGFDCQIEMIQEFVEDEWLFTSKGIIVLDLVGPDGMRYPVTFLESGRLIAEIAKVTSSGYFQSNLVIVPEVTVSTVIDSAKSLAQIGLKGLYSSGFQSLYPSTMLV
jgi:hypothetical protein